MKDLFRGESPSEEFFVTLCACFRAGRKTVDTHTNSIHTHASKEIRIALAVLFFVLITLLFLDFTGTIHACDFGCGEIRFPAAVLALNVGVVIPG